MIQKNDSHINVVTYLPMHRGCVYKYDEMVSLMKYICPEIIYKPVKRLMWRLTSEAW